MPPRLPEPKVSTVYVPAGLTPGQPVIKDASGHVVKKVSFRGNCGMSGWRWEPESDCADLSFVEHRTPEQYGITIPIRDPKTGDIFAVLDLDKEGRLLGLEVLNATKRISGPLVAFGSDPHGWSPATTGVS